MEAQEMKNQVVWESKNKESNSFGEGKNKEIKKSSNWADMVYVAPWHVYDQPS